LNRAYNEMANFNGLAALETPEFLMKRYEKLGGSESYNHYAVGWAHAMNTPYQWTKQVASHWSGTRNGTIVHWPSEINAKGEIRPQFHHVGRRSTHRLPLGLGARLLTSADRVRIRSRSTSASPPNTAIINRRVLVPVSAHGSATDRTAPWRSRSV
jgi:hypothetical protein